MFLRGLRPNHYTIFSTSFSCALNAPPTRGKTSTPETIGSAVRSLGYAKILHLPFAKMSHLEQRERILSVGNTPVADLEIDPEIVEGRSNKGFCPFMADKLITNVATTRRGDGRGEPQLEVLNRAVEIAWKDLYKLKASKALKSGGQTYSIAQRCNDSSARCYLELEGIIRRNLGVEPTDNLMSFYKYVVALCNKEYVWVQKKPKEDGKRRQEPTKRKGRKKFKQKYVDPNANDSTSEDEMTLEEEEQFSTKAEDAWFKISSTEFAARAATLSGFIKNEERGKLDARSVYTCSMVLKLMTKIIENTFQVLQEKLGMKGMKSTEVAKVDYLEELAILEALHSCGITQDETKYNETQLILLQNNLLYCLIIKSNATPEMREFFRRMLSFDVSLFSIKRYALGRGLGVVSERGELKRLSIKESLDGGYLDDVKHLITEDRYIYAGSGMSMGMRNVGGTMLSVAASNICKVVTEGPNGVQLENFTFLKISDDSIKMVHSFTEEVADACINSFCRVWFADMAICGCIGFNISPSKSYMVTGKEHFEFNSIIKSKRMIKNLMPKLPVLIMAGKNMVQDINSISKAIFELVGEGRMCLSTTPIAIATILHNWRIYYKNMLIGESFGVRGKLIRLLADANEIPLDKLSPFTCGAAPLSTSTLGLDLMEVALYKGTVHPEHAYSCMFVTPPTGSSLATKTLLKYGSNHKVASDLDYFCPGTYNWRLKGNRSVLKDNRTAATKRKVISEQVREQRKMLEFIYEQRPELREFNPDEPRPVMDTIMANLVGEAEEFGDDPDVRAAIASTRSCINASIARDLDETARNFTRSAF